MTYHVDSVPDTGDLSFKLWLPRWDSHGGRPRCRFEATTLGLTQLREGTSECMAQFLAELGQPEAKNVTWSTKRYLTPYFSDFPQADDWADRLAMTWSVEVETDSGADPEGGTAIHRRCAFRRSRHLRRHGRARSRRT